MDGQMDRSLDAHNCNWRIWTIHTPSQCTEYILVHGPCASKMFALKSLLSPDALQKASFNSLVQDQAGYTASSPPDPH
eukprot:1159773-Pelagomonas_calceolata.AAC.7